ncbi:NHL repeat-containing protein [Anaeromyxobacter paludicola]|uniref:NHL repeat containing protein n=1 Tax=Anaeromyxobacter paludicola TaxID=2918171 RepID=A0ABM7XBL8_9BACT|nr:hypothetical protein [Anaeromyxobacter paludicola]BDG09256.1 hypothetical protein AMPC_23690 [Anaeromyxobacter paludicola]
MLLQALTSALLAAALAAPPLPPAPYDPGKAAKGTFLYDLSDSDGPVPSSWASLVWDPAHRELYVVDRTDGSVGVFDENGMELYRFGQDAELGNVLAVAPLPTGELLVLASEKGKQVLTRCNFRGEPRARVELTQVPDDFAKDFSPDVLVSRGRRIFLAQRGTMKVLVADLQGRVEETHDFFHELEKELGKIGKGVRAGNPAMQAFNVDEAGDYLFTVAPLFTVFVVSPSGKVTSFGDRGSSPGKFNVVGGITRDAQGRFLVGDVLRSVVMVFTPELEFRGEFGGRGWGPGQLVAPLDLAVAGDRVFVSQSARRGVSVFQYSVQDPPAPPAEGAAASSEPAAASGQR